MLRVAFAILIVAITGACSATPGPVGPGASPAAQTGGPPPVSSGGFVPGGWTGTLTVSAVTDSDTTETSTSGEPGDIFFTTTTLHDVYQGDASDAFTVTGTDDEDAAVYGIGSVEMSGPASKRGDVARAAFGPLRQTQRARLPLLGGDSLGNVGLVDHEWDRQR